MEQSAVYVSLEFTPNPNTLKYSVNRKLLDKGAANFTNLADAEARSPLATKLLKIVGISGVMIGRDFVTVTKTEDGDWDLVHKSASELIESHLTAGEMVVNEEETNKLGSQNASEVERRIQKFLDDEIRPAVAMDGGDVTLDRFEDGVAYLHMQGACSGCPSSSMTLKMGIETKLKELVPEVIEVTAI
ncbi:MAG: NifU family protein [Bdellovibrionales bacterium]|nr:NifU family protein [Bdellovibrionales bacterium]